MHVYTYLQIHPDIAVRREIDRLPVLCENYENGCGWTGKLKEHEVGSTKGWDLRAQAELWLGQVQ